MTSSSKHPRFLVLRGGAIGDFILTLPALQALRDRWPDAYIELIGYPHIANLALAAGLVDHVDSLDRAGMARFFALLPMFTEEQERYVQSFDLVISFLHDPEGIVRENLRAAGAKQVICGSPIVESGHAIDHLVKPLETLAIYVAGENPRLVFSEGVRQQGRDRLVAMGLKGSVIAIHPGSGSPKKNWPADRFITVASRLRAAGRVPFFIVGEADEAVSAKLRQEARDVAVLSGCTLVELGAALSACAAYVGNDSGVTHLAAALGLPVVALFGHSKPDRWGPRGPNVKILCAPGKKMNQIDVETVLAALV